MNILKVRLDGKKTEEKMDRFFEWFEPLRGIIKFAIIFSSASLISTLLLAYPHQEGNPIARTLIEINPILASLWWGFCWLSLLLLFGLTSRNIRAFLEFWIFTICAFDFASHLMLWGELIWKGLLL